MRVLMAIALLACLGCVKVQVSSGTSEQRKDSADQAGKDWRGTFAENLRKATPIQQVEMTRTMIDSVCASYFRYSGQVSDQWRQASSGRGTDVSDVEMRTVLSKWNDSQQPLMQAYEESVDYGIDQIKLSQAVAPEIVTNLEKYRDHFSDVYNAVFFPKGSPSEYDSRIAELRSTGELISRDLLRMVERAR